MMHLIPHIDCIEAALKVGADDIYDRLREIVGTAASVDIRVKQQSSDADTMYWSLYVEVREGEEKDD